MFGSKIEHVRITKMNLDFECYMDLLEGRGIRLQSTDAFQQKVDKFTKKNEKVYDGLQSEFFGTDFGDSTAFEERYSCKCKKYVGKMYSDILCDVCGTKVEYNDIDLTKTGWIIIDHFSIISPIYAEKLSTALGSIDGEKVLTKILEVNYDENGAQIFTDKELAQLKKHPYIHKGMIWLKANIIEVLEYYEKRKPAKQRKLFKELKDDSYQMFASCIPVYSSILRTELPGEKGNKLFKLKINTIYQAIIRISNFINKIPPDEFKYQENTINMQLAAIQSELADVFNDTYMSLMKKTGIIYSKVIGGRYNYSARNIITPSSGYLRADEVELSYSTFMELFRSELINFYSKIKDCTLAEASQAWKRGTLHFDQTLYDVMQYMVHDKTCKKYLNVLISRNPCINYGSFMMMRIANVKKDIKNKTLTIPSNTLSALNADFDGDVLNIFRVIGEYFNKEMSRCMNPRYNLYISRVNGKINMECAPFKDETSAFYQFNNI